MTIIEKMRKDGYPKIIKGNGGYRAYLKDMQPLGGGDYMAIYRYPGGECCHSLEEIKNALKSSNNSRRRGCQPDHYRRRFYG